MELTAAAVWRRSSRSNGANGAYVEVADNLPGVVGVRDSKDPTGPALLFSASAWRSFVGQVRAR
ncbi:DUF397 domain-containing protein [Plantactinospora sp. CA-294935]|uniref:DUF397 domain-containing protein n=1 Tax=Plantactinospora sp. CA-294935 TaxID=3240012 RepID=UPI003D8AED4C